MKRLSKFFMFFVICMSAFSLGCFDDETSDECNFIIHNYDDENEEITGIWIEKSEVDVATLTDDNNWLKNGKVIACGKKKAFNIPLGQFFVYVRWGTRNIVLEGDDTITEEDIYEWAIMARSLE